MSTVVPSRDEIRTLIAEEADEDPADIADDDNLLEFGLHSLRMIRLASLWQKRGLDVNFAELAARPTVEAWHQLLSTKAALAPSAATGTPAAAAGADAYEPFELATMQHAYWVGRNNEQALGGVAAHLYAEFDGREVDPGRLESAVHALVRRHPMLRSSYAGDGTQRVLADPPLPSLPVTDLRDRPSRQHPELLAELAEIRLRRSHQRLPLEQGRVFEIALTLLPEGHTRLHVDIDIIAADAVSYRTLMAELAECYLGRADALPPIDYTYRRYLAEKKEARAQARERDRAWWTEQLDRLPDAPRLPLVPAAEQADPTRTVRHEQWLTAEQKRLLAERSQRHRVTPAVLLAAVFAEVVGRWSGGPRFLLNVPLFNREPLHSDVDRLIGDFSSSVMVPVDHSAPASVLERARDLQDSLHRSAAHAAYEGLDVLRDLGRHRGEPVLAPVVYTSGLDLGELYRDTVTEVFGTPAWIISQGPQVFLDAQVMEVDGGLLVNWDVREHAFPEGLIDAMFTRHRMLLEELLDPDSRWDEAGSPLLDALPSEQREVRDALNQTTAPRSGRRLHDGFFATAERTPDAVALIADDGDPLTYGELRERALRVAGALTARGVRAGEAVSIQLPKGPEQVVAVLGVLAAGAAYVPVGYNQPPARRDRILRIGEVALALTDASGVASGELPVPTVTFAEAVGSAERLAEPVAGDDEALAYVLFTSGSTGEPKGVEVPHRAAMNTVDRCNTLFALDAGDRTLALSSLEFDLSVQDMFGPLSVGGSVVVVQESTRRDGQRAVELIRQHRVTQLYCVPSLLDMMLDAATAGGLGDTLRVVLVGGDWVGTDLPGRLRALVPGCRFAGLGGATETAIHHTVCEVLDEVPAHWKAVPFGRPLGNVRVRVVNEAGLDCPDWVPGELWIGGAGVARGYRGDPGRTAERFVTYAGERWYRTGDLARYWPSGTVEFLGRADHQVKLRGYRIELGEVEAALRAVPGVHRAVADVVGAPGAKLRALVTGTDGPVDPDEVTAAVTAALPPYMVPDRVDVIDALPTTGEGKVDRRAVRARLLESATETGESVPPEGPLETALADLVGQVLGIEQVCVETDFFALGGDSVLGTRAVARIREWLQTDEVSVADLFLGRHVRGLASRLAERQRVPGRLEEVAKLYLEVVQLTAEELLAEGGQPQREDG